MTGITYGLIQGSWTGVGLGMITAVGFMTGVAWARPVDRPEEGATPQSSFESDVKASVWLGSVVAATIGVPLALELTASRSAVTAVIVALAAAVPLAAMTAAAGSQAFAITVTSIGLRLGDIYAAVTRGDRKRGRPWLLMWPSGGRATEHLAGRCGGFLEEARRREVLRSAGSLYQFRHASLQQRLQEHD